MRSERCWAAVWLPLFSWACSAAPIQTSSSMDQQAPPAAAIQVAQPSQPSDESSSGPLVRAAEVSFSFERAGQHFSGVLALPQRRLGEKLPGVVLVHGSGPMSRDGFMHGQLGLGFGFGFPVYAELSRELVKLGYVVARYDKRTCVGGGTCRQAPSMGLNPLTAELAQDTV